jgi:hypothetical protein
MSHSVASKRLGNGRKYNNSGLDDSVDSADMLHDALNWKPTPLRWLT